jgi:hypothetical protein
MELHGCESAGNRGAYDININMNRQSPIRIRKQLFRYRDTNPKCSGNFHRIGARELSLKLWLHITLYDTFATVTSAMISSPHALRKKTLSEYRLYESTIDKTMDPLIIESIRFLEEWPGTPFDVFYDELRTV